MKRSKGQIVETYDKWGKTYRIEFDINVDQTQSPWDNVFHFTTGGNCCGSGQRIPGFWAMGSGHFLICTQLHNNGNYCFVYKFNFDQTYHFVIAQNGEGIFKIEMDGNVVQEIQNENPQDFDNVKAYFSDPWHAEFHGCLSNLQISK